MNTMDSFRTVICHGNDQPIDFPNDVSGTTLCKYSNLIWNQADIQKSGAIIEIRFVLEYPTQHDERRNLLLKCYGPFMVLIYMDSDDSNVEGVQQQTIQQFCEENFYPFGNDHLPTVKVRVSTTNIGYHCFYSFHEHFDEIMNMMPITNHMLKANSETFSTPVQRVYGMTLDLMKNQRKFNTDRERVHPEDIYFEQILNIEPFHSVYEYIKTYGNVPLHHKLKKHIRILVQKERDNEPTLHYSRKILDQLYDHFRNDHNPFLGGLSSFQYHELVSIIDQSPNLKTLYERMCRQHIDYHTGKDVTSE